MKEWHLRHGFLNEKKNCCIFLVNIIQTLFLKNFKNSGALVVPFVLPFVPISADVDYRIYYRIYKITKSSASSVQQCSVSTKVRLLSDDKRESRNSKHSLSSCKCVISKSCPTLIECYLRLLIDMAICAVALQNSPQKVRPLLQSFLLFFELVFRTTV